MRLRNLEGQVVKFLRNSMVSTPSAKSSIFGSCACPNGTKPFPTSIPLPGGGNIQNAVGKWVKKGFLPQ